MFELLANYKDLQTISWTQESATARTPKGAYGCMATYSNWNCVNSPAPSEALCPTACRPARCAQRRALGAAAAQLMLSCVCEQASTVHTRQTAGPIPRSPPRAATGFIGSTARALSTSRAVCADEGGLQAHYRCRRRCKSAWPLLPPAARKWGCWRRLLARCCRRPEASTAGTAVGRNARTGAAVGRNSRSSHAQLEYADGMTHTCMPY